MSIDDYLLARLSSDDAVPLGSISTEMTSADRHLLERVRELLDSPLLPAHDADVADLYFLRGLGQKEIGAIVGIAQPSVSACLQRTLKRLRFLLSLPKVDFEEMRADLAAHPRFGARSAEVLVSYCQTHSQTRAAIQTGTTQSGVGHRVHRARQELRGAEGRLGVYGDLIEAIHQFHNLVVGATKRGLKRRTGCVID